MHYLFDTKHSLAQHFAQYLEKLCNQKERVYIALSGGTTPQYIFDVISDEFKTAIQWHKVWLFWVDERCVPPSHSDSNFGMTHKHLLSNVDIPTQQIFRVKGELLPAQALEQAIDDIHQHVPLVNGLPQFDVVVLGMGDDGHTASIFPHEIALWHSPNICELGHHPTSAQVRVTLTGHVINNALHIIFLVTGANKASKIKEIFTHSAAANAYPAALVDTNKCEWLLDKEAAGDL